MAFPRLRLTERQFLMLLMSATVIALSAAVIGSSLFTRRSQPLEPVALARVRWMRPQTGDARELLADYFDPSLMSLPSPRGFSRAVWLRLAPPTLARYVPQSSLAFLEPPADLATPVLLGQVALPASVPAGLGRLEAGTEPEVPALESVPAASNSVFVIEGELAGRRVLKQPVVPLAPTGLPVRRTRVLLAVGPDGRVRHAVLDRSCGHEALDMEAVLLTRELRFAPDASVDPLAVRWGATRFTWASRPAK